LGPYKAGLKKWGITKNYLNDLYVRFFRIAERRIAEITGRGIVCYISNFSYLGDPSFVVMRQRFLQGFEKLWLDCLNGDSRETGKLTPEGKPDPSIFSTKANPQGIRVGTSIGLFVRAKGSSQNPTVRFRHLWGASKRSELIESLKVRNFDALYEEARPTESNRYSFRPRQGSESYYQWPSLDSMSAEPPMLGLNENRGEALHDMSREEIVRRMRAYYDRTVSFDALRDFHPGLTTDAASFDAEKTRARLQLESSFQEQNVHRFVFKPFDLRWAYVERTGNLWNRVRPDLLRHASVANHFILTRRNVPKFPDGSTLFACVDLADQHAMHTDAYFIPVRLATDTCKTGRGTTKEMIFSPSDTVNDQSKPNLSGQVRAYLKEIGLEDPDGDRNIARLVWMHVLAVGYSPAYLNENADGIRQDWPRIPLPKSSELLLGSSLLGEQIADFLNSGSPIRDLSTWNFRSELKLLASPARTDGGSLKDTELELTAGWGHRGEAGVTMPGQGKLVERDYSDLEREGIALGAKLLKLSVEEAFSLLGARTFDVYLNDVAYWTNVPANVWDYTIGGYQVIKKWLSYREERIISRPLNSDEVRHFQEMARRIAALVLLQPALDVNYRSTKAAAVPWPGRLETPVPPAPHTR
jgi:hypothetical protein